VRVVVVAVGAQRRAEAGIVGGVPGVTRQPGAVLADGQVAAGVAGFGAAVAVFAPGAGVPVDDAGVDLAGTTVR
jgi:hypothetical protein